MTVSMSRPAAFLTKKIGSTWQRLLYASLALLGLRILLGILLEYRWYFPANFEQSFFLGGHTTDFFDTAWKTAFYVHILSSPFVLVLGVVLHFLAKSPRKYLNVHRGLGKLQIALVLLLLAPTGFVLATRAIAGPVAQVGFVTLALLTAVAAMESLRAAKNGRIAIHRRWSSRLVILLISPLLLRICSGLATVLSADSEWFYRINAWSSWLVPLVVYELILKRRCRSAASHRIPIPASHRTHSHRNNALNGSSHLSHIPQRDNSQDRVSFALAHQQGQSPQEPPMQPNVRSARNAFTVLEFLVVLLAIGILLGLFLPATRSAREAARRMQCSNNLKQLSLAILNYESAHRRLPSAMGGTGGSASELTSNLNRLSGFVALLPFLEQQPLWEQIETGCEQDGVVYPPMGPAPWVTSYAPWQAKLPCIQCPSGTEFDVGRSDRTYAFSIGDYPKQIHERGVLRGSFACLQYPRLSDVEDGKSTTVALAEISGVERKFAILQSQSILRHPAKCLELYQGAYRRGAAAPQLRGEFWADGAAEHGLFQTMLPPNSASCSVGSEASDGIYSASSNHSGGINLAMLDGSIHFVSESIDSGNLATVPNLLAGEKQPPSPFGVWGAMGTSRAHD